MVRSKKDEQQALVVDITTETIDICVLGTSPLIMNRMSEKAMRELLMPAPKKTTGEKKTTLKHDPVSEFRASPYTLQDPSAPAFLALMSTAFKGALRSVAVDMAGASKAQLGRNTFVSGTYTPIFGLPQIFCAVTRSADMAKTPDVRTRAILPEWAAVVRLTYTTPILNQTAVVKLFAAAGITIGVGDWRPEKGKGDFGQFKIVSNDDAAWVRIVKEQGRKAQEAALAEPVAFDGETESLLAWFDVEARRREFKVAS